MMHRTINLKKKNFLTVCHGAQRSQQYHITQCDKAEIICEENRMMTKLTIQHRLPPNKDMRSVQLPIPSDEGNPSSCETLIICSCTYWLTLLTYKYDGHSHSMLGSIALS
jgi:hypothetical protein